MPNGNRNYSAGSRDELVKMREGASKDMWALRNLANKFKTDAAKLQAEYTARLDDVPKDQRAAAQKLYLGEYQRKLEKMRAENLEQRMELVESMKDRAALATSAKENLSSPVIAASLYGLGSEQRFRCEQSLIASNAGPAVIAAAAERARLTGDKYLAAAAYARNADLPKDIRPLNKDYSQMMFGDEVAGVEETIRDINLFATQAAYASAEIDGDTAKFDKIKFSLDFPVPPGQPANRLDPTEQEAPEPTPANDSTSKISRGLAARANA